MLSLLGCPPSNGEERVKLKYCSSCMLFQPEQSGKIVQTANKKLKRFKCGGCLKKISERKFQGKGNK